MMKTLTLLQPWAMLVALEAKRIETRSWGTWYRGPLAIHADKRMPKAALCAGKRHFALLWKPEAIAREAARLPISSGCHLAQ